MSPNIVVNINPIISANKDFVKVNIVPLPFLNCIILIILHISCFEVKKLCFY